MSPANQQWLSDPDESLHVPINGLYADLEQGSGLLRPNDDFGHLDPRIRLAILADWMRNLQELRTQAFIDLADRPPAELLDATSASAAMRIATDYLGQHWPPEIATRLMRTLMPPVPLDPALRPGTE